MTHHVPEKKREPVEKIALRVIVYGTAIVVVAVCIFLAWLVFTYHLLPNITFRLIVLVILLVVVARVPVSIREVYAEVARRGG